jgi:hypothetical protein
MDELEDNVEGTSKDKGKEETEAGKVDVALCT